MNGSPNQHVGRERLGLFALLVFIAPTHTYASADIGVTDRHEIPAFVVGRTELVPGGANPGFPQPCRRSDEFGNCASQALRPAAAATAGAD